MAKPRNKGNNLTKKHKKNPLQKNFSGGGGGSSKKRKREDSPDAVSFSNKGSHKKSKSHRGGGGDFDDDNEPASIVSIRQRVAHRRLLFFIEQALMKHHFGIHRSLDAPLVQVSPQHNELVLKFTGANHAKKCVNLLTSLLPVNLTSESTGNNNGGSSGGDTSSSEQFTQFSVEVAPICIGDLVVLPPRLYTSMGQFGPLVLCWRIGENLSFINVENLQVGEITPYHYFNTKESGNQKSSSSSFKSLMTDKNLIEYTVIDVEKVMTTKHSGERVPFKNGKFELCEVSICKTNEIGQSDAIIQVKSHLGTVLQVGDRVMGYDLANANLNNEHLESNAYKHVNLPDVILVRKVYDKPKRRYWVLKPGAVHACSNEEDYERFLDELEEDEEMRKKVNMYLDPNYVKKSGGGVRLESADGEDEDLDLELEDAWKNVPHVRLEELLGGLSL